MTQPEADPTRNWPDPKLTQSEIDPTRNLPRRFWAKPKNYEIIPMNQNECIRWNHHRKFFLPSQSRNYKSNPHLYFRKFHADKENQHNDQFPYDAILLHAFHSSFLVHRLGLSGRMFVNSSKNHKILYKNWSLSRVDFKLPKSSSFKKMSPPLVTNL